MEKIRILCKTAATFVHPATKERFEIGVNDRLILRDAPAWIQQDKLFGWMMQDGTLEMVNVTATQKSLENDPVQGADATGKKNTRKPRKKPEEAHTDETGASEAELDAQSDPDAASDEQNNDAPVEQSEE